MRHGPQSRIGDAALDPGGPRFHWQEPSMQSDPSTGPASGAVASGAASLGAIAPPSPPSLDEASTAAPSLWLASPGDPSLADASPPGEIRHSARPLTSVHAYPAGQPIPLPQ